MSEPNRIVWKGRGLSPYRVILGAGSCFVEQQATVRMRVDGDPELWLPVFNATSAARVLSHALHDVVVAHVDIGTLEPVKGGGS